MSQAYTTSVTTVSVPPYDKNTGLMIGIGVAFLLGVHGAMRFYIGDTGIGLAQCITCGGNKRKC